MLGYCRIIDDGAEAKLFKTIQFYCQNSLKKKQKQIENKTLNLKIKKIIISYNS